MAGLLLSVTTCSSMSLVIQYSESSCASSDEALLTHLLKMFSLVGVMYVKDFVCLDIPTRQCYCIVNFLFLCGCTDYSNVFGLLKISNN